MTSSHTLLLLRHAEAESIRPGHRDHARRLTDRGRQQARRVGEVIRSAGWTIDLVLCSSALRARETLQHVDLPSSTTVEVADALYNAGSDSIVEMVRLLPEATTTALMVGHAPGLPGAAYQLIDPAIAEPAAWAQLESSFPPARMAVLQTTDHWHAADVVSLTATH